MQLLCRFICFRHFAWLHTFSYLHCSGLDPDFVVRRLHWQFAANPDPASCLSRGGLLISPSRDARRPFGDSRNAGALHLSFSIIVISLCAASVSAFSGEASCTVVALQISFAAIPGNRLPAHHSGCAASRVCIALQPIVSSGGLTCMYQLLPFGACSCKAPAPHHGECVPLHIEHCALLIARFAEAAVAALIPMHC